MKTRANIQEVLPEAYRAMFNLSVILNKTNLTPIQKGLIKIRASQINSCAFCLDMHTKEALSAGENPQRIFIMSAWRETSLFSGSEKALLALAEEVTQIGAHGVSDQVYEEMEKHFSRETIAQAIMHAVIINAWNRIAISSQLPIPE